MWNQNCQNASGCEISHFRRNRTKTFSRKMPGSRLNTNSRAKRISDLKSAQNFNLYELVGAKTSEKVLPLALTSVSSKKVKK